MSKSATELQCSLFQGTKKPHFDKFAFSL